MEEKGVAARQADLRFDNVAQLQNEASLKRSLNLELQVGVLVKGKRPMGLWQLLQLEGSGWVSVPWKWLGYGKPMKVVSLTTTYSKAADAIEGDDGNGNLGLFAKDEVGINLNVEFSSNMRRGRVRMDAGALNGAKHPGG